MGTRRIEQKILSGAWVLLPRSCEVFLQEDTTRTQAHWTLLLCRVSRWFCVLTGLRQTIKKKKTFVLWDKTIRAWRLSRIFVIVIVWHERKSFYKITMITDADVKEFEQIYLYPPKNVYHPVLQFRATNRKLPNESGRWSDVERVNRLCDLCSSLVVGDEFHYLLRCEPLLQRRSMYNVHN